MRRRQAFGANNTKQYLLVCFGTRFSWNLEIIGALIPCDVGADLQLSLIITPNPEFPQPRLHMECAWMHERRIDVSALRWLPWMTDLGVQGRKNINTKCAQPSNHNAAQCSLPCPSFAHAVKNIITAKSKPSGYLESAIKCTITTSPK